MVKVVDPSKVLLRIGSIVVVGIDSISYSFFDSIEVDKGISFFDPIFSRAGGVVKELTVVLQHSSPANSAFFDWCDLNESNSLVSGKTVLFSDYHFLTQMYSFETGKPRELVGFCIPAGKPSIGYSYGQAETLTWKFYCVERPSTV